MKKIFILLSLFVALFVLSGCEYFNVPTDTTDPTAETTEPTDPTDVTDPTDITDPTDVTDPTDITDPGEVASYSYMRTKILSIDRVFRQIEFLDFGTITYSAATVRMVRHQNGNYQNIIADTLRVGMENVYIRINDDTNQVDTIILDGEDGFSNIRVAIRNNLSDISNTATLYHDAIGLRMGATTTIRTFDNEVSITAANNDNVFIAVDGGEMVVRIGSQEQFRTAKRILVEPHTAGSETTFNSISRSLGTPRYKGHLEFSIVNNRILAINDIDLELYLHRVVPSEMPASFHIEALKAQSVAARTYAYMDI